MSILGGIFKRREAVKAQEAAAKAEKAEQPAPVVEAVVGQVAEAAKEPVKAVQEAVAAVAEVVAPPAEVAAPEAVVKPQEAVQASKDEQPATPASEAKPTSIADIAKEKGVVEVEAEEKPAAEAKKDDEPAEVQTIPLGEDEINSLRDHGYDQIKDNFTQTFVIEKSFWIFVDQMDPSKPGRKPVRVSRIAEIKAGSLMHALNMIGWNQRNVRLISVKNEYKGDVDVTVDGVPVARVALPDGWENFEKMGGGARNAFVAALKDKAVAEEKVKALLAKKMLVVSGWAYQSRQRINLKTSFDKVARTAAKIQRSLAKTAPADTNETDGLVTKPAPQAAVESQVESISADQVASGEAAAVGNVEATKE